MTVFDNMSPLFAPGRHVCVMRVPTAWFLLVFTDITPCKSEVFTDEHFKSRVPKKIALFLLGVGEFDLILRLRCYASRLEPIRNLKTFFFLFAVARFATWKNVRKNHHQYKKMIRHRMRIIIVSILFHDICKNQLTYVYIKQNNNNGQLFVSELHSIYVQHMTRLIKNFTILMYYSNCKPL